MPRAEKPIWKDNDYFIRFGVTSALGNIGDATAVPVLIEALQATNAQAHVHSASALWKIGDSRTLPRKIPAVSQWSAQQRIDVLNDLRGIHYVGSLRYMFPDTHTLCRTVLSEEDAEASRGAQTVLDWLNGDRELLIGSQPETTTQLLRALEGSASEGHPETLLRQSEQTQEADKQRPRQRTVWNWLFRKA